jgi:CHAD domain-containing protein
MKRYRYYTPLERALIAQFFHLKINTKRVIHSQNPRFLHNLRGAVLRIDFALSNFGQWIKDNKRIRKTLKKCLQIMGKVRNLDILLSKLEEDCKKKKIPIEAQRMIKENFEKKYQRLRSRLIRVLHSYRYQEMLEALELLISYSKLPSVSSNIFKKVFNRIVKWKKRKISSKNLHSIRIDFKELRYSYEFLNSRKYLEKVIQFQDILGKRQDAITVSDLLSRLSLKGLSKIKSSLIKLENKNIYKYEKKFYKRWKKLPVKNLILSSNS